MKRFLIVVAVLVLLAAGAIGVAVTQIDKQQISSWAAGKASDQLGRKVELGAVQLAFLPPGIRIADVRIAGDPGAPTLAEVGAIQLGLALRPLLQGAVVLSSLELERPRIALALGRDGRPVLPKLPGEDGAKPRPPAPPPPPAGTEPAQSQPIALSIERLAVSDGELTVGPWRVRQLGVNGRLESLSKAQASLEAVVEGIGRLEDGAVEVDGIGSDALAVKATGTLGGVDLAALLKALPEPPPADTLAIASGTLDGPFEVELAGSALKSARADIALDALQIRAGENELSGSATAQASLGKSFSIDLGGARVVVPGVLQKPAGGKLALSGALGSQPSLAALRDAVLAVGSAEIPLRFELAGTPQRIEVGKTEIDLASFKDWLQATPGPIAGRIRSEGLRVSLAPLRLDGAVQLEGTSLAIDKLQVAASGAVQAQGTRIAADGLTVDLDGQRLLVSGGYDLEKSALDVTTQAEAVKVEDLLTRMRGSADLLGLLAGRVAVSGPPDPSKLSGEGQFNLSDGRIRGFSLMKQFLGQFAEIGLAAARARGKDLSRFEEEKFERLAGQFQLTPGRMRFQSLVLDTRYALAELSGDVGVPGGELDLRGQLTLRREVGEELADKSSGVREEVIPIDGVGGTVTQPRLRIGRRALVALAARFAAGGGLGEKLQEKLGSEKVEEKIGKENAEAVKGLLEGILGGPRERDDKRKRDREPAPERSQPPPEPQSEPQPGQPAPERQP